MTCLPINFHGRLAAVTAAGDRSAAAALLQGLDAAIASGNARGFDADRAALAKIARAPMAKAAPARVEPLEKRATRTLPPQLQAEAEAAIAAIEDATGRLAKAAAMEEGRRIKQRLDDYWQGVAATAELQKSFRSPKSAGRM